MFYLCRWCTIDDFFLRFLGALGGGVSRSLCLDNYGKSLSSRILAFELDIPDQLTSLLKGND